MGESLFSLHVPSGFGGRAGSEVSTDCIFYWSVLAAATFLGGRSGVGGVGARARHKLGLLLGSVAVADLSGSGSGPEELEQELEQEP